MTIERSNDFESTAGADQDLRDLFHRTSQLAPRIDVTSFCEALVERRRLSIEPLSGVVRLGGGAMVLSRRRITMAMKVVTGGIAAAAVLMAMFVITPDVSVAVAYAGVRESLEKVTSISFVATTKGKAGPEQTKMTLKGRNKVRADRPHDEVSIFDHETKKMMIVYPRLRKAEVIQFEGPLGPSQVNLYEILTTAEGRAIEKLGERKFDDRAAVGYRVRDAHKVIWDVWVAPDTQLPIRMEAAGANNDGTVLSDFKYDELIDDSLFDMTPPEGFEVTSRTQNVEAEIKRQREEAEKNVRDAKKFLEKQAESENR